MKEATGELSTTVITVVAIAAIAGLFTIWLLPTLRTTIKAKTYCSSAVNCGECTDNKMQCHYYVEGDGNAMSISEDTITCDCDSNLN